MKQWTRYILPAFVLLVLAGCSSRPADEGATSSESPEAITPFQPYEIQDSTRIVTFGNGVSIYKVQEGPGNFPKAGMNVLINYHGMLESGKVFDSSFERDEPLRFRMGDKSLINGLEWAVGKLRFGSQAVVIVPPEQGYEDREDIPEVPPNSTLVFHVEVLGTF